MEYLEASKNFFCDSIFSDNYKFFYLCIFYVGIVSMFLHHEAKYGTRRTLRYVLLFSGCMTINNKYFIIKALLVFITIGRVIVEIEH